MCRGAHGVGTVPAGWSHMTNVASSQEAGTQPGGKLVGQAQGSGSWVTHDMSPKTQHRLSGGGD